MDKIRFMRLWDLYRNLLTETQQEITDMYFNLDLTVSEIAEQKGITRQAASDCLAVCKTQLEQFEEKLGFSRTLREADLYESFLVSDVTAWAKDFLEENPEYAAEMDQLNAIVQSDYEDEIQKALVNFQEV